MNWTSRNLKPITFKTAISSCNICTFETKSRVALKKHYTIVHTEEVKKTKGTENNCNMCHQSFSSADGLKDHNENCHVAIEKEHVENLKKRIFELEQIVANLQKKDADKAKDVTKNEMKSSESGNVERTENIEIDEPIKIPSHLKPVHPEHRPLLSGYNMYCQAVGNGACGTNCCSIHTMEDDSEKAMVNMKRKVNIHIADNYDDIYANVIGLPYTETVFGEEEKVVCKTPQELKQFLRSERALKVYSNFQEMQAMANIFNMAIDVFTYGTRTSMDGEYYSVAEWRERIVQMKEASSLAEYREGHFPPMALYHSANNHFDLLVADTSRLVSNGLLGRIQDVQQVKEVQEVQEVQVNSELQAPAPFQETGEWTKVPSKVTRNIGRVQAETGDKIKKKSEFACDECYAELESKGLLDAHKFSHEETRSNTKHICDDCDEVCNSEDALVNHMKVEHDDGTWTCEDCQFQTNRTESLRNHLKKTGHQPSEASKRQTNELKECYNCRDKFEGYIALMNHRAKEHPSNKICKNIPECSGLVNDKKCWYVHPELKDQPTDTTPIIQEDKDIECRRCRNKYGSRNEFMNHYTTEHTSLIVCRDWVKNNCRRERCWYRHSHLKPNQVSSTVQFVQKPQDFPPVQPPPQPPAQAWAQVAAQNLPQQPTQNQSLVQKMITQMALRMNTMELEVTESRKQMHILQQMLSNTTI